MLGHGGIDHGAALPGQGDQQCAPVARMRQALDEPLFLQLVDAIGHRPRRDHHRIEQLRRRKPEGWPGATKGGQQVKARAVQPMALEDRFMVLGNVGSQAAQPSDQPHGGDSKIRTFPVPLVKDVIDGVFVRLVHAGRLPPNYLDVKIRWTMLHLP